MADANSGEPVVWNGLALCKLHHAAFDANIRDVTKDYAIELRLDILEEHDGPMRWVFSEIEADSFHWCAERARDDGNWRREVDICPVPGGGPFTPFARRLPPLSRDVRASGI